MFGADLFTKDRLLPLFRSILGVEGFKPLDCVGEPEEMILAMHYASRSKAYAREPAMELFEHHFPPNCDFEKLEQRVFTDAVGQDGAGHLTRNTCVFKQGVVG